MKKYDVIVIGSGGGTKISTPASYMGYKAAIVEKAKWGGTCLNRGCIPSKMLIHPANVIHTVNEMGKLGVDATINKVHFSKIVKRITKEVDGDSKGIPKWYEGLKNLDYYEGEAKFVSDKVLLVNGKKITASKIFIATGARPRIPNIPGLKGTPFMTSSEALRKTKLPEKLLVIGGGYIGCELGHAYGAYGSQVHLIVRGKELLAREDVDIRKVFTKKFSSTYNVHFGVSTEKVSYSKGKFTLTLKDKNGKILRISGDGLLVATGVIPNTDNLGLENTSINVDKRGFIRVNRFMETAVKGVYGMGDCVGNYMFRHSVNFEGEFLFNSLFVDKKRRAMKYPPMPHAVFSSPEIGSVGSLEDGLKQGTYIVGSNPYSKSAQGMARLPDVGLVKLIFDKKSKKLIGAHIVGEEAATMIHQLIYAMTFKATVDDLLKMIYIHPAMPEIVRNAVRNAKEQFGR